MFIAIVGTPSAGKRTVLKYLIEKHGFSQVGLEQPADPMEGAKSLEAPTSNLSLSSSPSSTPLESPPAVGSVIGSGASTSRYPSVGSLLDFATHNWLQHHVTTDLRTYKDLEPFLKRPFFLLISVDGPLRIRFKREKERTGVTLEDFIDIHDKLHHGPEASVSASSTAGSSGRMTDFGRVMAMSTIKVDNNFPTIQGLWSHLDSLDLMDEERLRPGWDTYFMTLASLASHRSNCMKRRVGALLVRSKRILSTGYNGTPRGTKNCNHGGCRRCNGSARGGEALDECLCLHAEENALLEAGRERIGEDSVIYCNTCPCLRCSVKIVQCGVREVVYNQSYSMDVASAAVLKEGGVILRQLHMP